jgi:KaiC/GvpD/RAD55 family RecA-like ATPase
MDKEFKFSTDYQFDILKYTVTDKNGFKALELYDDSNFSLIEHGLIAFALKSYYKGKKKIPKNKNLFKEHILDTIKSEKFHTELTKADKDNILGLVDQMYEGYVKDGDELLEGCRDFVSYVKFKDLIEGFDLTEYKQYNEFVKKAQRIISLKEINKRNIGSFLIKDIKERQFRRQDNPSIIPTPFRQVNKATNGGGYSKGSIIVILDKPKQFKTAALVNVARGYLRKKKKIFYVDLENGADELFYRMEQSISNKGKKDIMSGKYDAEIQKIIRKYKRLGTEVYIKRFPTSADMGSVAHEMDLIYREHGIKFDVLIFDYLALMSSISGATDDVKRISDVYLDAANMAAEYDIDHIWTAHHVTREAYKHEATKYADRDIAKCIDIVRHAQAIWGLNRSNEEVDNGILRMELVVQRDGEQQASSLFEVNPETQRMEEFTVLQRTEYERMRQQSQSETSNFESDL